MSGTCDCGRTLYRDRQQCRQCALEADAVAVDGDADDRDVERYEHAPECASCGEATYLGEWLLKDGRRAPNGVSDDGARYFCEECGPDRIIDVDETREEAPAFERASELRADGGCDEVVIISDHARTRWITRSDLPRLDPSVAWDEAEQFPLHDLKGDEGRWHREGGVVLLRKDSCVVTVLDENVGEALDRAELQALGADVAPVPSHVHPAEATVDRGEQR